MLPQSVSLPLPFTLVLYLGLLLSLRVGGAQVPFRTDFASNPHEQWSDLSRKPHENATGNLIFETVSSLLQHWPNTRYRNGHTIVPGTVAAGTLLYHGGLDSSVPTSSDWVAMDPEHAYHFCGEEGVPRSPLADEGTAQTKAYSGCWQLTLMTTRPLKVVYLDGSSAANMKDGTLDTQDLLVWGEVDESRWLDEKGRIEGMCAWGREFGVDGYVRMEMDFEIMLCHFDDGVELLAADYLASWRELAPPMSPTTTFQTPKHHLQFTPAFSSTRPDNDTSIPMVHQLMRLEMLRAGSWHNRHPGDTRIALDLSRLVTLYDVALAPSLVSSRARKSRLEYRVKDISAPDLKAVVSRLHGQLGAEWSGGSGIDWRTLFRVVLERYAGRLELLAHLVDNSPSAVSSGLDHAAVIQRHLRVILTPYILHSATPDHDDGDGDSDAWAAPVWRACATRHTAPIHANSPLRARMTPAEHTLLRALDDTGREICRVVVRMWARGVRAGLDELLPLGNDAAPTDLTIASRVLGSWRTETQALMAWLDWSVWVKCRPACGPEEMCYLPTWPYFWHHWDDSDKEEDETGWRNPQPRCIRQVEPYSSL